MLAKLGKQVEFLPENGKGKGVPDVRFDNATWDIKSINKANESTIRAYIKDARKADNVMFYAESDKYNDVLNAVIRESGRFRGMGRLSELPDVYCMDESGILKLLWKK
ncbi:MAG: hypothetical protein LBR10_05160 [Prevotellaceae bacterium]|nr:hypothetical protein [Prevotellaceae bacterium]